MDELGRNALRLFSMMKLIAVVMSVVSIAAMNGCGRESDAAQVPAGKKTRPTSYVDGGDSMRFVEHPENLPVGIPGSPRSLSLKNPLEGNASAIASGASCRMTATHRTAIQSFRQQIRILPIVPPVAG